MNIFTVFLDACVLYPAPLRDLLMELAVADLFRAKWSRRVHDEWIAAVLRERSDLSRERLERTRALMDAHVRDAVVTDYEDLIDRLDLPDPKDRHVPPPLSVAEPISSSRRTSKTTLPTGCRGGVSKLSTPTSSW